MHHTVPWGPVTTPGSRERLTRHAVITGVHRDIQSSSPVGHYMIHAACVYRQKVPRKVLGLGISFSLLSCLHGIIRNFTVTIQREMKEE